MSKARKGDGLVSEEQLRGSPHIVYWKMLDRIGQTVSRKGDPGPLIHMLWAMLAGVHDREFLEEWEEIRSWQDIGEEQSKERPSVWEVRALELAVLVDLMRRKNMLEQASVVDYV